MTAPDLTPAERATVDRFDTAPPWDVEPRRELLALVADWQSNAESRPLGDPTAATWAKAARQLLAVLNGKEPAGW